jgi:hypothetical protein
MGGPGLLLLDGVVAVEVQVGDRTATELMGSGDLLQPRPSESDELIEHSRAGTCWSPHASPCSMPASPSACGHGRSIAMALLRRAGKRADDLDVQRAIACQPRLEVRLALMLWHLAARWGKVELGGIRLSLPLTHRLLGQLVGAERPSVSHALARLAEAELVTGRGDEWHLHGSLEHHLAAFAERGHPVPPQTAAAVGAPARGLMLTRSSLPGSRSSELSSCTCSG